MLVALWARILALHKRYPTRADGSIIDGII